LKETNSFLVIKDCRKTEDYYSMASSRDGTHQIDLENTIGRIKFFRCLKGPWRHDIALHHIVFTVATQITALEMILDLVGSLL
jgi:hypothetical protein